MIKLNGEVIVETADGPEISNKSLRRAKRQIDRQFKRWCERRGIDPDSDSFRLQGIAETRAAMGERAEE
jgi:hypothetical protein